jgi:hypothetical protein
MQYRNTPKYFRPPDNYTPPSICEECLEGISYRPIMGRKAWLHEAEANHPVIMRREGWWDTETGTWRKGNGITN